MNLIIAIVHFKSKQKPINVLDHCFSPVALSEQQTLPEFIKTHSGSLPLTALVVSGYQSENGQVEISCNEVLRIHSLQFTPVVCAMKKNKPLPPIPLTTSTPFSVLYNPNSNRKEAMEGFMFNGVTSLLSLMHMPKVVCVMKEWNGDSITISKGEILVINKMILRGRNATPGIVTFSISTMTEKFLPEKCCGSFSTDPMLIQMPLQNIFAYICNPFPCEVFMQYYNKIILVGCDFIENMNFSYYVKGKGAFDPTLLQLPTNLPDIKLCLIADVLDGMSPKSLQSNAMKEDECLINSAIIDCDSAHILTHTSTKPPPPPLPPKSVTISSPSSIPPAACIESVTPLLQALRPTPPPKLKRTVSNVTLYSDVAKVATVSRSASTSTNSGTNTCNLMRKPATLKQTDLPTTKEEVLVELAVQQRLCTDNVTLAGPPASSKQMKAMQPVVAPGPDLNDQDTPRNTQAPYIRVKKHDKDQVSSLVTQLHDPVSRHTIGSQTLPRHFKRTISLSSVSPFPTISMPPQNMAIPNTAICDDEHRYIAPIVPPSPTQLAAPGKKLLSSASPVTSMMCTNVQDKIAPPVPPKCKTIGEVQPQRIARDSVYPKLPTNGPPLPPPYIPDEEELASNVQEKPFNHNGNTSTPSIAGYCPVSKPLTLLEFASLYSGQLPISIHVYAAEGLMSGPKYLDVTAIKEKQVIVSEDYAGRQTNISLVSPEKVSLLYGPTNIEDIKDTLQGRMFCTISDLLKLNSVPKVVCATRSWSSSHVSVEVNEILIIQSVQKQSKGKGIVVYSVCTRSSKFLPSECTAHFSTEAALLGVPLLDLVGYVPDLFPCKVCSVKYGKVPKCYPIDVITLKELTTTSVLECVPLHQESSCKQDASVFSIPTELPGVEVVVLKKENDEEGGEYSEALCNPVGHASLIIHRIYTKMSIDRSAHWMMKTRIM